MNNAMTFPIVALALGAAIVLSPVAAFAQADQVARAAAPAAGASAPKHAGSRRSSLRRRSTMSEERARASAEHMRKMRQGQQ